MPLNLAEARERATLVHDAALTVELDLTSPDDFGCRATVTFGCSSPGATTFLELSAARELEVRRGGELVEASYDGERITLRDLGERTEVEISARLPYTTDGDGMHTMTDPADGERYVCAYTSMDITRKIVPVFDQPDLKTMFTVSVVAPAHWTVIANGLHVSQIATGGEATRWHFDATPPISSYLFSLAAGPWVSETWEVEYDGRSLPFGWHARASLADALTRDAADLRAITESCFRYYTRVFDEPYPFADYQQVFGPGLNWGAMEFPGVVTFRDEYLPRDPLTPLESALRAAIIAHEMAHMWFGDLVTMRWWEDSWLNESFADYMGYAIAAEAAGYADTWVSFSLGRKPTAYRADRRRSTHPIAADAETVPDVDTAFANFDMITYAKGASVLRQLVTWLGEDVFLAGVNRHLTKHRFGNADLADFLDSLDAVTDRDVRSWAGSYLLTTGFDTIRVERDGGLDGVPLLIRDGSRAHRLRVTAYDDDLMPTGSELVDLGDEPVRLEQFAGQVVVPNSADEAYAALVLDDHSWTRITESLGRVADPVTRSVLWSAAIEAAESGRLSVGELIALVSRHLPGETHPAVFESVVRVAVAVVRAYADPTALDEHLAVLARVGHDVLADAGVETTRFAPAARLLAAASTDSVLLSSWLDGSAGLPEADQNIRWRIVKRLAALGDPSFIAPEAARDRSTSGELARLSAEAAIPTADAKATAWERLMSGDLSNREFIAVGEGFWSWGQHDLVAPYLARYVADGLDLGLRTGQGFAKLIGDVFPVLPLTGAQRTALREAVTGALAGDVPTVLRRDWEDSLDDLDRVISAT